MDIKVPRTEANEIAKNTDFDYAHDREYANLCTTFEELFGRSANDIIVGGLNCQQRATPSMNVDLSIGLGYCKSTGKITHTGSLFGPIAIVNGGAQTRIDTLEIRLKETDYDSQQRAFKDPVTGYISYQDINTKTRFEIEAQVIQGTEGAGVAPNHTTGWVKIAEVTVDAGETTSILDADIENCTGGYDTEITTNWTAETAVTFKLGSIEDFKAKFRVKHKENGDHKNDVIKDQHINFGTGANQVSAVDMPIADDGSRITATEVENAIQEIAGSGRVTETLKSAMQDVFTTKGDILVRGASIEERLAGGLLNTILKGQGAGQKPIFEKFALRDVGIKIVNGSRSTGGDQVITCPFAPSLIIAFATDFSATDRNWSIGVDDMTSDRRCLVQQEDGLEMYIATLLIKIRDDGSNYLNGIWSARTSSSFTITWTVVGAGTAYWAAVVIP